MTMSSPPHDLDAVHEHLSAALDALARALPALSRGQTTAATALARRLTEAQSTLSAMTRRERETAAAAAAAAARANGASREGH
jgi:hypothetical protein